MLYRCPCIPLSSDYNLSRLYAVYSLQKSLRNYFEHEYKGTILLIGIYSPGGLLDEYSALHEIISVHKKCITEIIVFLVCDEKVLTEEEIMAHKQFTLLLKVLCSKIYFFYSMPHEYLALLQGNVNFIEQYSLLKRYLSPCPQESDVSVNIPKEQLLWVQLNWDPHDHSGIYTEEKDLMNLCYWHSSRIPIFHYISHLYYTKEDTVFFQEFLGYEKTLFFQLFYFESACSGELIEQKICTLPSHYYNYLCDF